MSFADVLSKVFKASNIGTFIFFALNFSLIAIVFYPYSLTPTGGIILFSLYISTVAISFSPIGEWVISAFAGAKKIRRRDMQIKLIPLLEIVYGKAKRESPNMIDSVYLKIVPGDEVNAYALGRKTICVTESLLNAPDEMIMGIFAHELGHLANRHSEIQLLIGGANVLISIFLLMLKLVAWMITGIFSFVAIGTRRVSVGCLIGIFGSIATLSVFLWTKFCMVFLMWSARNNEFVADEFAFRIGFGEQLAWALDNLIDCAPNGSFLKLLYSSHPRKDEGIARLQELGAAYSRW